LFSRRKIKAAEFRFIVHGVRPRAPTLMNLIEPRLGWLFARQALRWSAGPSRAEPEMTGTVTAGFVLIRSMNGQNRPSNQEASFFSRTMSSDRMNVVPTAYRAKKFAIRIGSDADRQVDVMLDRQNLTGQPASRRDFPEGAIGCVDGALPTRGNCCFFTGTPINGPDVNELVDADAAARLFPEYDGAFTGIFLDAERQVLVVTTDCLGMQPLYMRHANGELTFVSETKALRDEPDLAAWGAFISIGHPIGERSLVSGLVRVPPASVLTYDCVRHKLDIRRYWQWPEPSDAWRDYDFLALLERDMRGYAALGNPGTLLLSGGFDSRLLLFLLKRAAIPAHALIVAHDDEYDDTDGRLAESIAKIAAVPFRKARPPRDFFSSSAYVDYLNASDAGYPSLDLFIAKVASQIDSDAVWDGLAPGFVFMPLHQPEGGFDAYLRQEVRGPGSATWRAAETLFKPEVVAAMREGFAADLQTELSRLSPDMHGLARFVIENRSRNRPAMNPLKVYANHADAYTPGLSKNFMTHAATIPFQEKQYGRFYRNLLAGLDKRSLAVPFVSGGDLMRGKRLSPAYYRERLHVESHKYRMRYPNLYSGTRHPLECSSFLGERLFEDGDNRLDPRAREKLTAVNARNYPAWKLLFHWKTWQWVHEDRLETMLGACVSSASR
jgi:hypothetical protein